MKRIIKTKLWIFLLSGLVLFCGNALATPFGTNITINDGMNGAGGWYAGTGKGQEDHEVEPGNIGGQQWDLEGFFLNGRTLTMVGGFDFVQGGYDAHRNETYRSGDIFIDLGGDSAEYGSANAGSQAGSTNPSVNETFGYDYVFDLDFSAKTYNLIALTSDSNVKTVYFSQNNGANPWRYHEGGTLLRTDLVMGFYDSTTDSRLNSLGFPVENRYGVSVDLSTVPGLCAGTQFVAHNTMQCGNDNLMGSGVVATPEPATFFLFGIGLVGIAGAGRRRFFKRR